MIEIANTEVHGLHRSLYASGFPMRRETPESIRSRGLKNLGEDYERGQKLAKHSAGTGHPNFLNGIKVWFDLRYNLAFLKQIDRYHWVDYTSSQSTMYTLTRMREGDFYEACDVKVSAVVLKEVWSMIEKYQGSPSPELFHEIIYSLPAGFRQWVEVNTNYLQLKTIYHQRKNHKLEDWNIFCDWIKTLPVAQELIIGEEV